MSQPSSENEGVPPPTWTGKTFEKQNVEGYLFPWNPVTQQPLLVQVPGCEDFFLPLFSTEEKLHAHMEFLAAHGGLPVPITVESRPDLAPNVEPPVPVIQILAHRPFTIKQVQAGGQNEFLDSIFEAGIRIMVNPYITERNTTKWTEVIYNDKGEPP